VDEDPSENAMAQAAEVQYVSIKRGMEKYFSRESDNSS
jgi:hypothetical protein